MLSEKLRKLVLREIETFLFTCLLSLLLLLADTVIKSSLSESSWAQIQLSN